MVTPELLERVKIGHLFLPADRHVAPHGAPPAAPLVVIDELAPLGQCVATGKEIVVARPGATVEDHHRRPLAGAALEEGDAVELAIESAFSHRQHGVHGQK